MEPFDVICHSSDRLRWHEERRKGIGASDMPAILGLTSWASPTSVQADKWGLIDDTDSPEHVKWGNRLENAILEGFGEEIGQPVSPYGHLIRSISEPILQCTPDGKFDDVPIFVQAKNTILAGDWEDGPPERVLAQVQQEMFVTGTDEIRVVALLFGNRLVWSPVERDKIFIDDILLPAAHRFWELTQAHEPAAADASEHTKRALQLIYPEDSGNSVALDGRFVALDDERQELSEAKKAAESRLREIDNEIRAAMKDASFGVLSNGVRYSLKTISRKAYTVKATQFRALRRLKAKDS